MSSCGQKRPRSEIGVKKGLTDADDIVGWKYRQRAGAKMFDYAIIINGTHVMAWFADGGHIVFSL
jgi:hypothetical protein